MKLDEMPLPVPPVIPPIDSWTAAQREEILRRLLHDGWFPKGVPDPAPSKEGLRRGFLTLTTEQVVQPGAWVTVAAHTYRNFQLYRIVIGEPTVIVRYEPDITVEPEPEHDRWFLRKQKPQAPKPQGPKPSRSVTEPYLRNNWRARALFAGADNLMPSAAAQIPGELLCAANEGALEFEHRIAANSSLSLTIENRGRFAVPFTAIALGYFNKEGEER